MPADTLHEPWRSFLHDIDAQLSGRTEVHCLGGSLAKKHRVYIDIVTVADVPERYEERLIDVYGGEFRNLNVRVFERHDLELAKLGRNQDYDREDVRRLAEGPG